MDNEPLFIAQVGRTVGLYGDLKLHLHTDFPEQFQPGVTVQSDKASLQIESYNSQRNLIRFVGHASIDAAKRLTNTKLYSTAEHTAKNCKLGEGEYYWFDIIGSSVHENGLLLGSIEDIDRMPSADYLAICTDSALVEAGAAKEFLLPYIPRYILSVEVEEKKIFVVDAKEILEAS